MGEANAEPFSRLQAAGTPCVAFAVVDGRLEVDPTTDRVTSAEKLTEELTSVLGRGLRSL